SNWLCPRILFKLFFAELSSSVLCSHIIDRFPASKMFGPFEDRIDAPNSANKGQTYASTYDYPGQSESDTVEQRRISLRYSSNSYSQSRSSPWKMPRWLSLVDARTAESVALVESSKRQRPRVQIPSGAPPNNR